MSPNTPVTALKGVGKVRAQQLEKLGIRTLHDLVCFFPRTYEDRTRMVSLNGLIAGEPACFHATVVTAPRTSYVRKGLIYTRCTIADDTARIRVTWFNQPWISDNLQPGHSYFFYGALAGDERRYEIQNPVAERDDSTPVQTRCIIPIYPLTKGISSKALQSMIFLALDALRDNLPELLPQSVLAETSFMPVYEAYLEIHRPTTQERLNTARQRLVFEEFFQYSLGLCLMKARRSRESHYPCRLPIPKQFYDSLSFSLTSAQDRALKEIEADLLSGSPMNRLVQGDVGSGKTMVALGAMMMAVENGYQAALMAPTELLAVQHYNKLSNILEPLGIHCELLTGSVPAAKRRRILDYIAVGAAKIVIGTHALFTETVDFHNLGLVVIDEQHRFGVRQRAALSAKGSTPHMLVLSATPIPRTLALMLYGDLDVSVIDELPPGREPVETFLVSSSYRARLLGFIRKQVSEGRQVYVVCPAVEDNEETNLTSAESMYASLQSSFPEYRVGLVHGKLRSEAKDYSMDQFLRHETDILVATTVIEVGVDVPNATLMVVEDADRFGLSQLHQLRGRVGRGGGKAYCILVSDNRNPDTRKRLKALCATNDGFKISQQDLELRGPGDFFGARQSGLPMFHLASLSTDLGTLKMAQKAAESFAASCPDPEDPATKALLDRVAAMFTAADDTFN
ncbi:MAG: ATP-dependent DNA helicase RecG [Oscillospiraceae bacterium]|nr:ATP-dependent DNA helicase RecG [Oscillospiraceae bacterium]